MTELGPEIDPDAINNAVIVAGTISSSSDPPLRAGVWSRREAAPAIGPDDHLSQASAINARGEVAGTVVVVDSGTRAAIWK